MKHHILTLLAVAAMSATVQAQTFLTDAQRPDASKYLPAPPDTVSVNFFEDWRSYQAGKELRKGKRYTYAKFDLNNSMAALTYVFQGAYGMDISQSNTPKLYSLINRVMNDAHASVVSGQQHFKRKRPFTQFNESSALGASRDVALRKEGSYPAGYACLGWATALVLAEINIDRQDTILHRGYEFGESCAIMGVNYSSDIKAGRVAACALVARLHADDNFMNALNEAKAEYKQLIISGVSSVTSSDDDMERAYNLLGIEIDEPQHGLYIKNGRKVLKR